ncbi:zinc-dependent peptidase [Winogradskyella aurantiaca]|uniref:zinc-dependent peptidase n=1 Tax=Winogradskyella aurantiaca TaxID=2219558 RepID=UPI000E1D3FAA|nr:zinc-dependent peptidase [Winogradskyella aurantiaca]
MMYFSIVLQEMNPILRTVFLILFFLGMFLVVFSRLWIFAEQQFAERIHRPFFLYSILLRKKLKPREIAVLETKFSFYTSLNLKQQKRFRHRVANLKEQFLFHPREALVLTDEMRVLVTATAVMISFGFRDYSLPNLENIILYPGPYHSELGGGDLHKGEYSPAYKTLVFSWPDFLNGYDISNDNLNLGIHELSHVLHIKCHFSSDISSQIYNEGFHSLKNFLKSHEELRQNLVQTSYFRAYAFNNEVEFIAVLIECYFETPSEFQRRFPDIYHYVERMLNFSRYGG